MRAKHAMKPTAFICFVVSLLTQVLSSAGQQAPSEPPDPKPSAAMQKILEEADQKAKAKQPPEALRAADRALALARETKDRIGEAQAHRSRALSLQDIGRTEEALAAWREAAAAWERSDDGPGRVEALAEAALLLMAKQPSDSGARLALAETLAVGRAETKRPLAMARALQAAGQSSYDHRHLGPAREFWSGALALLRRWAPDSLDVALSLTKLGDVARQPGDLATASDYYRRALVLQEQKAPNSLDLATTLTCLGVVTREQGDLAGAHDYHRRALRIQEQQAPGSLAQARSLNNLGEVATLQGDLAAAKEFHRQALAIQEKVAPDSLYVAFAFYNLGEVAWRDGDLDAAKKYFRQALTIRQKRAPDSLDAAKSLVSLGAVASQQSDPALAKVYFRQALAIQEKLAPDSLYVAVSLNNLGTVETQQRNLAAAKEYHQRALALQEKQAPDSLSVAESLRNLGALAQDQGNLEEAEGLLGRAWELVRRQAAEVAGDEARQAFGASTARYVSQLVRCQLALGKSAAAFVTLEEGRAQALQQLLLERQVLTNATESKLWSSYRAAVGARDRAEQALSRASVAEALARGEFTTQQERHATPEALAKAQAALQVATKKYQETQSAYTRARVKVDELWAGLKKNAPRAFAPPLSLGQAQKALPTSTLFVAFSVGEQQTHVFLLGGGSDRTSPVSVHTIPVTSKEIATLVVAFRDQLTRPRDLNKAAAASRALFAKLFPAETHAAVASAQRLLISPDGPLWEVPFAALVTNAQGAPKYLGEAKPITYTQSLTVFAQARSDAPQFARGRQLSAIVVGYPIFDRLQLASRESQPHGLQANLRINSKLETRPPPRTKLITGERSYLFADGNPPLPLRRTRAEALEIARLYGAVPLLDMEATEAEVRKRIGAADVVHLATHGYLNPVRAMSSGLLLTEPEKEPAIGETDNDGVLQAWEIYSQLKLHADLVVLSACETGRGEQVRGEGIVGMTRALQYAGARSILASQWKVNDRSTAMLMVAFHRNLRQGMAKDAALQRAMAEVRSQSKRTAHPYYWAAFMLTGDPENPNLGQGPR